MAAFDTDGGTDTRVESPCIGQCTLDDGDICTGCYRSVGEISAWSNAGEGERREILASAQARRKPRVARG